MKKSKCIIFLFCATAGYAQKSFKPEDTEVWSPEPPVVVPAKECGQPPSDAVVLFNGKNLSEWLSETGTEPGWEVKGGAVTVIKGKGDIVSKRNFGSCQLHLEWRSPSEVKGNSQGRGNSGVFLQNRYEVQILDNYENKTYVNGQAGSVYKQHIPLANACRKPGEWQTYDIIFNAPVFNADSTLGKPAFITVIHNGVLVQNQVELKGTTMYIGPATYKAHGKAPILLQEHGDAVSYRNIWIRELK